ncbi:tonB-system energizer ExbB [Sinirhodobacter populi]|uniref:Biopolymer transport protein ExbB n=1 Tax=Paenirhodobacter populi TaxID=2306993 RepID=A0A443K685_9RHOB|nr:tonB-system energizer ExbB [Sinirhodobacter populi]
MTHPDQTPHRLQRYVSITAMIVAGQMLAAAPLWAQDVPSPDTVTPAPETTPAPEAATPAPEAPPATPAPEATPAAPETAAPEGAAETAPAQVPETAETPAAPVDQTDTAPAADAPTAPATDAPAAEAVPATEAPVVEAPVVEPPAPEPMPNVFEDPAGAITHVFTRVEADPNLPHDLSPWGMFRQADIVVKLVMIGLAVASLVTWTVLIAKTIELSVAKRRARTALLAVHEARTLDEATRRIGERGGPAALMLRAAREEIATSEPVLDFAGGDGVKERVEASLRRIEAGAGRKVSVGTGLLATIGSTAPFVGLFGTVWGIMNAFIGISKAQTTNLAVVAPGIAEALLATALGLVAAIPAVIIYNHFARTIARYRQILSDAGVGVEILVSRDLDFRKVPQAGIVHPRQAAE